MAAQKPQRKEPEYVIKGWDVATDEKNIVLGYARKGISNQDEEKIRLEITPMGRNLLYYNTNLVVHLFLNNPKKLNLKRGR